MREIEALQGSGYIERCSAAVRWTDRIAPAMQEVYLWQADGQSMAAAAEANFAAQLAAALAEIPEPAKRVLAREAARLSELEFATFARHGYPEFSWVRNPSGEPPWAGAMGLLKAVYRSLRAQDD